MAARLALTFLACIAAVTAAASAQSLQRLHVREFTLSASTLHPAVEQPFTVTVTIRVAERLARLDNVFLPSFFGAEELGDVSSTQANSGGTVYRETLQLVAHGAGMLSITPAYLDAIDARNNKAMRFSSNALQLDVVGPLATNGLMQTLRMAAIVTAGVVVCLWLLAITQRRRLSPPASEPEPQPEPETSPQPDTLDLLQQALAQMRARRDRASVMRVRELLWQNVGAPMGGTLSDTLKQPKAGDARTKRLLISVERAAFIDDARVAQAIEEIDL